MSEIECRAALDLLRDEKRSIYEGRDGSFYVDYSNGLSPRLSRQDVERMRQQKLIEPRYSDFDGFFRLIVAPATRRGVT